MVQRREEVNSMWKVFRDFSLYRGYGITVIEDLVALKRRFYPFKISVFGHKRSQ